MLSAQDISSELSQFQKKHSPNKIAKTAANPIEYPYRLEALKLAYQGAAAQTFHATRETELEELDQLFQLAEYNYKFVLGENLNLVPSVAQQNKAEQNEKLRKVIDNVKSRTR